MGQEWDGGETGAGVGVSNPSTYPSLCNLRIPRVHASVVQGHFIGFDKLCETSKFIDQLIQMN